MLVIVLAEELGGIFEEGDILRVGLVVLVTVAFERRVNAILFEWVVVWFGEGVIGSELVEDDLLDG